MIGIIPVSMAQSVVSEYFYPRGVDKEADFSRWPFATLLFHKMVSGFSYPAVSYFHVFVS